MKTIIAIVLVCAAHAGFAQTLIKPYPRPAENDSKPLLREGIHSRTIIGLLEPNARASYRPPYSFQERGKGKSGGCFTRTIR